MQKRKPHLMLNINNNNILRIHNGRILFFHPSIPPSRIFFIQLSMASITPFFWESRKCTYFANTKDNIQQPQYPDRIRGSKCCYVLSIGAIVYLPFTDLWVNNEEYNIVLFFGLKWMAGNAKGGEEEKKNNK